MSEKEREDECCFVLQLGVTSGQTSWREDEGSWTRRKTRRVAPLEREREREQCTHYLHSEKGVGSQSSPPFRREREREKSKCLNGASCCVSLENWSKRVILLIETSHKGSLHWIGQKVPQKQSIVVSCVSVTGIQNYDYFADGMYVWSLNATTTASATERRISRYRRHRPSLPLRNS